MTILITGAEGQLGRKLVSRSRLLGLDPAAMNRKAMDITRKSHITRAMTAAAPAVVVNAAAYTDVDRAETQAQTAHAVNAKGPALLAGACAGARVPLIHISTDFVFDGRKGAAYTESDPISPLGVYARTKAAGEAAVRTGSDRHIILRTAWLYSEHGPNFVTRMLQLGREKRNLGIVADQHGCPTSAADLADAILLIVQGIIRGDAVAWGTYHYCGKGITTWYDFARTIFRLAAPYEKKPPPQLEAMTTAQYPSPARRPAYSALDCRRIRNTFNICAKPWPQSLAATIEKLYT